MVTALKIIALIIFGYFLGNIHFARIIAKSRKDDITTHGSGNPGTMNVVRTHGIILGSVTLILDALKGAIPALIGFWWFGGADGGFYAINAMHVAGLSAVLGHVFPVFYKFKGGKGVATSFGFFTVVNPLLSLILFAIGLALFLIVRIGSVSSLVFVSGFVIYQVVTNFNVPSIPSLFILLIVGVLIFVVHKSNVQRLINNQENVIDLKQTIEKDKQLIAEKKQNIQNKRNAKK